MAIFFEQIFLKLYIYEKANSKEKVKGFRNRMGSCYQC